MHISHLHLSYRDISRMRHDTAIHFDSRQKVRRKKWCKLFCVVSCCTRFRRCPCVWTQNEGHKFRNFSYTSTKPTLKHLFRMVERKVAWTLQQWSLCFLKVPLRPIEMKRKQGQHAPAIAIEFFRMRRSTVWGLRFPEQSKTNKTGPKQNGKAHQNRSR